MTHEPDIRQIIAAYPSDCQPAGIESLGSAGGFSGARLWRLRTPRGALCLRRWPKEHPTSEGLEFIQAVLRHVWQAGFRLAPAPVDTQHQAGYVRQGGHLWELTPWMPGDADYRQAPSKAKLRAALTALATFHRAAESFPSTDRSPSRSPGVAERLLRLQQLMSGGFQEIASRIETGSWPEFALLARQMIDLFPKVAPRILSQLAKAAELRVSLQPCIRDVWHAHVLFAGDQVTGLIDFGAMRVENVATDIARLLSSLVGNDLNGWQQGLDAYTQVRPLSADELQLIEAFDQSGSLLGGINWVDWIYLEGRHFEDRPAVLGRLGEHVARLLSANLL
jgi:Ser/Thr protein kinase RdoA (MazF antagonist)